MLVQLLALKPTLRATMHSVTDRPTDNMLHYIIGYRIQLITYTAQISANCHMCSTQSGD